MAFKLFFCLGLLTIAVAEESSIHNYEFTTKSIVYNHRNNRKLVTDNQNRTESSTEILKDKGTNYTVNSNTTTMVEEKDKNGTLTQKPDAEKEGMDAESSQVVFSYPPYGSYEVTENVVDIPDDRTLAGPIITNYTKRPPLNLGKPNNQTDKNKIPENNIKNKKNSLSILHINAEFDDKVNEVNENKVVGVFKGIKEYIHSFHRGIVNGIHSFFHKHDDHHSHGHGERFERAAAREVNHSRSSGVKNVDKTDYFVRQKHISMT